MGMQASGFLTNDALALGWGLLYGYDNAFSLGFRELVKKSGVSHLVAASGANLEYILFYPKRLIGRRNHFGFKLVSLFLVCFYWLVAHQSGSLWRAIGMWLLRYIGHLIGRPITSTKALFFWSLLCLCFFRELLFSHSYLLSAIAIVSLAFSRKILSGENNNRIFKHSKSRMCFLLIDLKNRWLQGFIVFIGVEMYLWLFFKSFQPIGIYTTLALELLLPSYMFISTLIEGEKLLFQIFHFSQQSSLPRLVSFFGQVPHHIQKWLFIGFVLIMQTLSWFFLTKWGKSVVLISLIVGALQILRLIRNMLVQRCVTKNWEGEIDFTN